MRENDFKMTEDFNALRHENEVEMSELRKQFMRHNRDLGKEVQRKGLTVEYDPERDHLYLTFGDGEREGVALFTGSLVVIADPETMEAIAIEVPDFTARIRANDEDVLEFDLFAEMIQRHPITYLASEDEAKRVRSRIKREMSSVG